MQEPGKASSILKTWLHPYFDTVWVDRYFILSYFRWKKFLYPISIISLFLPGYLQILNARRSLSPFLFVQHMTHSISDPCLYMVCALGIKYGYVWWQLRTFIVSRWDSVDIYSQINILEGSFWFLARPFNCGPWKIWYFLLIEKSFEDVHSDINR